MARVGRHNDPCLRVQDSTFPQISQQGKGSKAGELRTFVLTLQKAKEAAQKRREHTAKKDKANENTN